MGPQSGKSNQIRDSNQASDVRKPVLCMKKLHFLARTGERKISFVACGFSSIEIHFSDNPKSLISNINEVYIFFNKI